MLGQKNKGTGPIDGDEGRGIPLADAADEPAVHESDEESGVEDFGDRDFGWEEGDPADRRRDPLRKP